MFIEVVHINGTFQPERRDSIAPPEFEVARARIAAITALALDAGHDVLYRLNLGGNTEAVIGNTEVEAEVVRRDSFMMSLGADRQEAVTVRFDGYPIPPEYDRGTLRIEDALARKHRFGYVVGAYTSGCVYECAKGVRFRNPGVFAYVDPGLSIAHPGIAIPPRDVWVESLRPEQFLRSRFSDGRTHHYSAAPFVV